MTKVTLPLTALLRSNAIAFPYGNATRVWTQQAERLCRARSRRTTCMTCVTLTLTACCVQTPSGAANVMTHLRQNLSCGKLFSAKLAKYDL